MQSFHAHVAQLELGQCPTDSLIGNICGLTLRGSIWHELRRSSYLWANLRSVEGVQSGAFRRVLSRFSLPLLLPPRLISFMPRPLRSTSRVGDIPVFVTRNIRALRILFVKFYQRLSHTISSVRKNVHCVRWWSKPSSRRLQ